MKTFKTLYITGTDIDGFDSCYSFVFKGYWFQLRRYHATNGKIFWKLLAVANQSLLPIADLKYADYFQMDIFKTKKEALEYFQSVMSNKQDTPDFYHIYLKNN